MALNSCPHCGGQMLGDGVNTPVACERVEVPADRECDALPLYCTADPCQPCSNPDCGDCNISEV